MELLNPNESPKVIQASVVGDKSLHDDFPNGYQLHALPLSPMPFSLFIGIAVAIALAGIALAISAVAFAKRK